ncbi:MAG: MBL fold metallo-hydrolase [Leptolyngbyaceae cyanobacterium MO_188.B28]|nr:MBL fold metallo-hydrolase [Leptolyngbyaceae cyanobacterium MO_188.B28]
MKRRKLVRYAGASFLATLGLGLVSHQQTFQAQTSGPLSVQWLGHTCFLFSGGGRRVLVNPFRPIGCTAGYRPPQVEADLIMISSRLFDEGSLDGLPGNPRLLAQPGEYELNGMRVQGINTDHDREGGRRFGSNVVWRWNQAGVNIVHLGGIAGPIELEQQILIGRPDVLLAPVGGSAKAYNPEEAAQAVRTLNPKLVIPTHYRTQAADPEACDIVALDEFLALMEGSQISRLAEDTLTIAPASLTDGSVKVQVLSYPF